MSSGHPPERDDELGRALRELPVPPHRRGFEERLRRLLERQSAAARSRRGARAGRLLWRLPIRRPLLAAAAVAAGVTVVVLALGGDGRGPLGPERATVGGDGRGPLGPQRAEQAGGPLGSERTTAAEVVARARQALAAARTLTGSLAVRDRTAPDLPLRHGRLRFALTDRGDVRILGRAGLGDIYYDARAATQITLAPPGPAGAYVERGLASGPPDPGPSDRLLQTQLAAVVRSLAAARDAAVAERRVGERPAWVLSTRIPVNKLGFTGDRLQVAIDRATGLPLRVRETFRGRLVRDLRLREVRVDRRLPRRAFRPPLPKGTSPTVVDAGFRARAPERAAQLTGYAPLAPRELPAGFRTAETRVARRTRPTGAEAMNPPSRDVVSTAYRRGLDRVVVSTRRRGPRHLAWTDPISGGESVRVTQQQARLTRGALAGATAHLVIDPLVVPHLWILGDELIVTISGPLSRAQLLAAAESLEPVTP